MHHQLRLFGIYNFHRVGTTRDGMVKMGQPKKYLENFLALSVMDVMATSLRSGHRWIASANLVSITRQVEIQYLVCVPHRTKASGGMWDEMAPTPTMEVMIGSLEPAANFPTSAIGFVAKTKGVAQCSGDRETDMMRLTCLRVALNVIFFAFFVSTSFPIASNWSFSGPFFLSIRGPGLNPVVA